MKRFAIAVTAVSALFVGGLVATAPASAVTTVVECRGLPSQFAENANENAILRNPNFVCPMS